MFVKMTKYPTDQDWLEVKEDALITEGYIKVKTLPDIDWKKRILRARHTPIRDLEFKFLFEVPSFVATHLSRHLHAQPFIESHRVDRVRDSRKGSGSRDDLVYMRWIVNGEELLTVANKRLCNLASKETREVIIEALNLVKEKCPEFADELVPNCVLYNGCREMRSCGYYPQWEKLDLRNKVKVIYREYDDDKHVVALDVQNMDGTISRMKMASVEKDIFDCEIARLEDPEEDDLK